MKKLISIGVALALLTMVVVPGAVAAADYETPPTYSKVPFAIIQSGFAMVGALIGPLQSTLGLPTWLDETFITTIGDWAGGPLSWTVDMLAWGLGLGADVWLAVGPILGMEEADMPIGTILDTMACGLMTPWVTNYTGGAFDPCEGL